MGLCHQEAVALMQLASVGVMIIIIIILLLLIFIIVGKSSY
jgi:hypothetical protein